LTVGQHVEEMTDRFLQLDVEGLVVERPHPNLVRVRALSLMKSPGALDRQQLEGDAACGRLEHTLPGILKIVGRQGCAVAPTRVGPQVEAIATPPFQDLPMLGDLRHDVQVGSRRHQSAEYLLDDQGRDVLPAQGWVQSIRAAPAETQGVGRRRQIRGQLPFAGLLPLG
jgi:hypothetical protein